MTLKVCVNTALKMRINWLLGYILNDRKLIGNYILNSINYKT